MKPILTEALERQATSSEKTRLGNVLVQMGVLEQPKLEELIREQFSTIISEFINSSAGSFSFEPMEVVDRGEIEMETAEFLVASGLESTHVLLDAARRADEERQEAEQDFGAPTVDADPLDTLLEEVTSPSISGETVYRLLDLGSDTCGRCLLFAVYPRHFAVVGHFGLEKSTDFSAKRLSDLQIPRQNPSILARAADKRHPILAKLPATEEEARILDALGGLSPSKSFAVPLQLDEQVILVFYGDYLPMSSAPASSKSWRLSQPRQSARPASARKLCRPRVERPRRNLRSARRFSSRSLAPNLPGAVAEVDSAGKRSSVGSRMAIERFDR